MEYMYRKHWHFWGLNKLHFNTEIKKKDILRPRTSLFNPLSTMEVWILRFGLTHTSPKPGLGIFPFTLYVYRFSDTSSFRNRLVEHQTCFLTHVAFDQGLSKFRIVWFLPIIIIVKVSLVVLVCLLTSETLHRTYNTLLCVKSINRVLETLSPEGLF